ncbi:response regulator transcription factor [Paenibacillus thailandensis]|uniref:Response regulator transcription factor n=1 Tax=Paenibacillus thailandensis TaxID=393250 RepID=A0ABW5R103_9BACL
MKPKVLIAEDERRIRELIADYLEEAGMDWCEAEHGDAALVRFREERPDLVILDILMPGVDGYDVCEAIRKESGVPIIFLTAKGEEDDKLLGYDLGADDYMTKPFSPKVLTAKVKALLKRTEAVRTAGNGNRIELDGLAIDPDAREAEADGEPLPLAPKEFDLLLYFMQNRNRVLTRDMLLDHVWGFDYDGDLRTVDTHVKRLRQKLGKRSGWIVTFRGNGYRLMVAP